MSETPCESVRIITDSDLARIHLADGPCTVSAGILHRSALLSQAASSTDGYEIAIRIPVGVVQAWLHALRLLQVDLGNPSDSLSTDSHLQFQTRITNSELVGYLTVRSCVDSGLLDAIAHS